jgi:hypothetical protein
MHNNNVGHDNSNNLHHNSNSLCLRNSPTYGSSTNAVSSAGLTNSSVSRLELNNSSNNHLINDGPPTPEMDLNLNSGELRKSK